MCVVDVFQEGHDGETAAVSVSTRPRKVGYHCLIHLTPVTKAWTLARKYKTQAVGLYSITEREYLSEILELLSPAFPDRFAGF